MSDQQSDGDPKRRSSKTAFSLSEQDEILEFYQTQLVDLKELLFKRDEQLLQTQQESKKLNNLVNNLKENNLTLSMTFNEIQREAHERTQHLEERLAKMSVERAEKEIQIDTLTHELNKYRKSVRERDERCKEKDLIIQSMQNQIEMLIIQPGPQEDQSTHSLVNSQSFEETSSEKGKSQQIVSPAKTGLNAESINVSNEDFQHLKQQNQTYLSLVESFKTAINKGESLSQKKQNDIKMMMEALPSSVYKILYEGEVNKLNDKTKSGEILIWEQEVMNLFINQNRNEARIQEKIGMYIRNFFPERFRGKLWKFLVGNQQHLTKQLYNKIVETIPSHPLITEELLHLINSDLKRTFQLINNYADQQKLKDDLREILMVWNLYRPDIGYVQGMTYIAFMFLIRMDKVKAFKCFANLLFKSKLLLSLYSFNHSEIEAYFQTFNWFLNDRLPDIGKHMQIYDIPKQAFLVEWFYTIFARAFNLIISSKCWDCFLFEGDVYVYRICLGIFSLIQSDLLKCEYEDTLLLIRNCSLQLNEQSLFKSISKFKILQTTFKSRFDKELGLIQDGNPEVQKIL